MRAASAHLCPLLFNIGILCDEIPCAGGNIFAYSGRLLWVVGWFALCCGFQGDGPVIYGLFVE